MSDRDTQFLGFAKALHIELLGIYPHKYDSAKDYADARKQLIARWAYDLVEHTICHVAMQMGNDSAVMFVPRQNMGNYIPDMTELPKESS